MNKVGVARIWLDAARFRSRKTSPSDPWWSKQLWKLAESRSSTTRPIPVSFALKFCMVVCSVAERAGHEWPKKPCRFAIEHTPRLRPQPEPKGAWIKVALPAI